MDKFITVGMAAPQVGILQRFFIVPTSLAFTRYSSLAAQKAAVKSFNVIINPQIKNRSPEQ